MSFISLNLANFLILMKTKLSKKGTRVKTKLHKSTIRKREVDCKHKRKTPSEPR